MADYPSLGLLTGISYQSGVDYYSKINGKFHALVEKKYVIKPNPNITMVSVDCDEYCKFLDAAQWDTAVGFLMKGVDKIMAAGCDVMGIVSNTGHLAYDAISRKYPDVSVVHIADCTAAAIKAKGLSKIALLGTKATMTQSYLISRFAAHGIECLVPEAEEDLDRIFNCIKYELGFGVMTNESRNYFLQQVGSALHDIRAATPHMKCMHWHIEQARSRVAAHLSLPYP